MKAGRAGRAWPLTGRDGHSSTMTATVTRTVSFLKVTQMGHDRGDTAAVPEEHSMILRLSSYAFAKTVEFS